MKKTIVTISLLQVIIFSSCKVAAYLSPLPSQDELVKFSHQIILFGGANKNNKNQDTKKQYVFPLLVYREQFEPFSDKEKPLEGMLLNYPNVPVNLIIPDSMRNFIDYYPSTDLSKIVMDSVPVLLYSPLLPTIEKRVYIMQFCQYFSDTQPGDNFSTRLCMVSILKYRITRQGKLEAILPFSLGIHEKLWSVPLK
jgi:hypothetical protein